MHTHLDQLRSDIEYREAVNARWERSLTTLADLLGEKDYNAWVEENLTDGESKLAAAKKAEKAIGEILQ